MRRGPCESRGARSSLPFATPASAERHTSVGVAEQLVFGNPYMRDATVPLIVDGSGGH